MKAQILRTHYEKGRRKLGRNTGIVEGTRGIGLVERCYKIVFCLLSLNFSDFLSSLMPKLPDDMNTNYSSQDATAISVLTFSVSVHVINIWNSLPSIVTFSSLSAFKRTLQNVDFSASVRSS